MPNSNGYISVAYGNGYFVALAANNSSAIAINAYSTNGTTWTAGTTPLQEWFGITYGNGTFVAVGAVTTSTLGAFFAFTRNYS